MIIRSFSVNRYRNIISTPTIKLEKMSVIIGPNNQGKTNLIRALFIALGELIKYAQIRLTTDEKKEQMVLSKFLSYYEVVKNLPGKYNYEEDYPKSLRTNSKDNYSPTIVRVTFRMTEKEEAEFSELFGVHINNYLIPIDIELHWLKKPNFIIRKRGKTHKLLNDQKQDVAAFIGNCVEFRYIPAIRTEKETINTLNNLIKNELIRIEETDEYKNVAQQLSGLYAPFINEIKTNIISILRAFMPNIADVSFDVPFNSIIPAIKEASLYIDDGVKTDIKDKGDGVKSLASIGLMRMAAERNAGKKQLILAIEEPESHLHSNAIHEINEVFKDMSINHQVLITTHCAPFVIRSKPKNNIIVSNSYLGNAYSINKVRKIMGVKPDDNLLNAKLMLLVEGTNDQKILSSIMPHIDKKFNNLLKNNIVNIYSIGHIDRLIPYANYFIKQLCLVHIFIDNDKAAQNEIMKVIESDILKCSDITQPSFIGNDKDNECEIEDMFNPFIYEELLHKYGIEKINILNKQYNKWSSRMGDLFKCNSRAWNKTIKQKIKEDIANIVSNNPEDALNNIGINTISNLCRHITERIT